MDGRDSSAMPLEQLSCVAGGMKRGIGRASGDAIGQAERDDGESSEGSPSGTLPVTGIESFTNRMRMGGGSRIRRTLGAGVVLLAGLLVTTTGWGQAMGRLSLDGPSPLPLAPKMTEPAAAPKTVGTTGANDAAPVAVARATGVGEPEASTVARGPAPLPEIKPPEPPKPASNPAVSSGTPAPAAGSAAGGIGETKPVNEVEKGRFGPAPTVALWMRKMRRAMVPRVSARPAWAVWGR
jgi:hypothetical protein